MNFENISKASLIIFDELKDDSSEEAQGIIVKMDEATEDNHIKEGIKEAVAYLEKKDKLTLSEQLKEMTKGFAF